MPLTAIENRRKTTPSPMATSSSSDMWGMLKTGRSIRNLGKKDLYRVLRWGPMAAADLVIEPEVSSYGYDDFAHAQDLVRAGELATRAALPEIRKWLEPESTLPEKVKMPRLAQPAALPVD